MRGVSTLMAFFPTLPMERILVSRREYKYAIADRQLPAIRDYLLRYCVPDANAQTPDWYAIRSLYLDDSDFTLFQDAKIKAPYRLKLRARAYGDASGSIKLEVKRRVRDLVVKTSATVKAPQWAERAPGGLPALAALNLPSMAEFVQFAETFRATPRLLVYYERQAFSSLVDDYVRVTFDRHIQCQSLTRWDLRGDPRAWLPLDAPRAFAQSDSQYVMEVKFTDNPPDWLRDMILHFGLERRGYSKYVRGVARLWHESEPAWDLRPRSAA